MPQPPARGAGSSPTSTASSTLPPPPPSLRRPLPTACSATTRRCPTALTTPLTSGSPPRASPHSRRVSVSSRRPTRPPHGWPPSAFGPRREPLRARWNQRNCSLHRAHGLQGHPVSAQCAGSRGGDRGYGWARGLRERGPGERQTAAPKTRAGWRPRDEGQGATSREHGPGTGGGGREGNRERGGRDQCT